MLRLVGEQTNFVIRCSASHVLGTFNFVGCHGVGENLIGPVLHIINKAKLPRGLGKKLALLPLPVLLEPKTPACPGMIDRGDGSICGHRHLPGRKQNLFAVDYLIQSAIGEARGRTNGGGAVQAVWVDDRDDNGVVQAVGVPSDDGKCSL